MPDRQLIEEFPLYRKKEIDISHKATLEKFVKVTINQECKLCRSKQTFTMINEYYDGYSHSNYPTKGAICKLVYLCSHCQHTVRTYIVKFSEKLDWVMKVGQFPAWEIITEKNIDDRLSEKKALYSKGLICESQGYGIGAFGYYRRIVEEIIQDLLNDIESLIPDKEKATYQVALEKTKETRVTQEKIDLVKDLLPPILRPNNMNPLGVLHSALSEGLHASNDDECLEYAQACREILAFLTNQIAVTKSASSEFTENMRKLLNKKTESKKND